MDWEEPGLVVGGKGGECGKGGTGGRGGAGLEASPIRIPPRGCVGRYLGWAADKGVGAIA